MHRHLTAPTFVLSSVRTGSTLLRAILGGHSELYAPHETHLGDITVGFESRQVGRSMELFGHTERELRFLLWDALLSDALARSGKKHLVNKSPNDVFIRDQIAECWPDARFIFLIRHPSAILRSWRSARPIYSEERRVADIVRYCEAVEEARNELSGPTVRYEDLTRRPEATIKELCDFLGVAFEEDMLDYGRAGTDTFKPGLGDWVGKIHTGEILPDYSPPRPVPPELKNVCEAWGYPTGHDA
ncbi:sulfotransferase family protein [Actinomadura fibrosa]|uniref:Sulfotransferase family protein n=1 Tax=Actinomadura fibrosa TaxID=111802 RepID=A0ABW2Y1I0_9ACTN|nr:sulfotransferase [Actinomadura fibrosa]